MLLFFSEKRGVGGAERYMREMESMAKEDQDQVERRSRFSCLSGPLIEKK